MVSTGEKGMASIVGKSEMTFYPKACPSPESMHQENHMRNNYDLSEQAQALRTFQTPSTVFQKEPRVLGIWHYSSLCEIAPAASPDSSLSHSCILYSEF